MDLINRLVRNLAGWGRRRLIYAALSVVALVFFATIPLWLDVDESYFGYYFFIVCIYVICAQAWNLLAGYTGQISLAGNAFFGLGAFTMALLWWYDVTKTMYYFDPLLMFLAGVAPVILAIIIGIPLLSRLRGDYFSFGTLGVALMIEALFLNGGSFTRGAEGIYLESSRFVSLTNYYWLALGLAAAATLAVYLLVNGRIGLAFKAIREDEVSAASHGINVLKYKLIAFMISAFMAGVAGSVFGYYKFHVEPDGFFNLNWLFYPPHGRAWRDRYDIRPLDRCILRWRAVRIRRHIFRGLPPSLLGSTHHLGYAVHARRHRRTGREAIVWAGEEFPCPTHRVDPAHEGASSGFALRERQRMNVTLE